MNKAKREHAEICRIESNKSFSEAVVSNGIVYLSGQVAIERKGAPIADQIVEVLDTIDRLLVLAGSRRDRLLFALVHLADIADRDIFNREWERWLAGAPPPARTTAEARLIDPAFRIEITIKAACDAADRIANE